MLTKDDLDALGVTMEAERVTGNPLMADDRWAREAAHWRCTLTRIPGATFTVHYSMGSAHGETPPTIVQVLDCLVSDFRVHEECGGYWDYVETFGVDPSRESEASYRAGKAQSDAFFTWAAGELLRFLLDALEED